MILVTGATGMIGRALVHQLLDAHQPVRVLTRDPGKLADLADSVEVAQGDFYIPATLETALQGVERMFLLDFEPQQVRNVLEAGQRSGLKHIVKLSTIEAGHEPMIGHGKPHRERELLIEASGLDWTHLRPTIFMSNAFEWIQTIKQEGKVYYAGGDGKVSPVDPGDIAAVAAVVLTQEGHACKAYPLTGAELLSFGDMTRILSGVLGKPLEYVDISDKEVAAHYTQMGLPAYVVEGLVGAFADVRKGRFAYTTDWVQRITGRAPRVFEQWCQANQAAFGQ
jgi:uncharacterized protein YbjT (DUF2867 family)